MPPVIAKEMLPFVPPLHPTFVVVPTTDNAPVGCVTLLVVVVIQPLASVSVREYAPAVKAVAVAVLLPFDHA